MCTELGKLLYESIMFHNITTVWKEGNFGSGKFGSGKIWQFVAKVAILAEENMENLPIPILYSET